MLSVLPTIRETAKPPRRKRWIPLSLRLFAAILVVLLIGSLLSVWLPYHREQQIAETIKSWGGIVDQETSGPEWLRRLVGDDRMKKCKVFDRVVVVLLEGPTVTDPDIAQLSRMTNLNRVSLHGTALTDAGLIHLSGMRKLEELSISYTAVTDSGLAHLRGCTNLKLLRIGATGVTEKGNAELKKSLPHCKIRY